MRDKATERWRTYESFYIQLGDKRVADIVVTNHAKLRYQDRIDRDNVGFEQIAGWAWECLKQGRITP